MDSIETTPSVSAPNVPDAERCDIAAASPLAPCTIVIFGASGDLTSRKLIPALYTLYRTGALPKPFSIVGCARSEMTDKGFRDKLKEAIDDLDAPSWDLFAKRIHYKPVEYGSEEMFRDLAVFLKELDLREGTEGNRIFYLAIPPTLYGMVAEMIGRAGLAAENKDKGIWTRIVVEKPFGRDLQTALSLDRTLHGGFREHQIFRIDHYLAKETVQDILMLRFANAIFEPIWNRSYIDYVGIIASEKLGVEHRAGYYEQAGVIRDMFQNHLLQLLALTAMEPPSVFMAARVQDEKVKVFRALKPFEENLPEENLILGQYDQGVIDGEPMAAYREEPDVDPASLTPTFAAMRLYVDNWRWRDVPFYLISGKRLRRKVTRIVVQFKKVPHSMFRNVLGERILANRLLLGIYPEEEIRLTFQTKSPGAGMCLRPVTMDFKYETSGPALDAYEKVLLDCIQGDHMLFWRQDGVELSWAFLTPILAECEECSARANLLHPYRSGSWGPGQSLEWVRRVIEGITSNPGKMTNQ